MRSVLQGEPSDMAQEGVGRAGAKVVITWCEIEATLGSGQITAERVMRYLERKIDIECTDLADLTTEIWSRHSAGLPQADDIAVTYACWMMVQGNSKLRTVGAAMLQALAAKEVPGALYEMSAAYLKGHAVDRNLNLGFRLCQAAFFSGTAAPDLKIKAAFALAELLLTGRGTVRDPERSFSTFAYAAHRRHAKAAYRLGQFHHGQVEGWKSGQDLEAAAQYYELAAELGEVRALTALGILHVTRSLKAADQRKGVELLQRAHQAGDANAAEALRRVQRR